MPAHGRAHSFLNVRDRAFRVPHPRPFGTPVVGMGFRISIEAARMSLDMVWAEIALAAIAGTAFYGVVALAERATTFWHPSYRT